MSAPVLVAWSLILALAVALIALPALLLWRAPEPAVEPPSGSPRTEATLEPAQKSPERRPGENAAAKPPAASAPASLDRSIAADASPPVPTDEAAAPLVERRWVHGGAREPGAAPERTARPAAPAREDPLDRSPEARRRRVERFGGTIDTENAVEAGLAWLAAHQAEDGSWHRRAHDRQCPPDDRCPGLATDRETDWLRPGVTGLCLLAFLGAGYTDRQGPHQDVIARAVVWLLRAQQADGGFSPADSMAGYNDTVATFALAEYYALTREVRLEQPLRAAVARLERTQQELGGWDYLPQGTSGRNDTSITGWAVQALQACAAAGIPVPGRTLVNAAVHFGRASESDGRVWYADAGTGFELDRSMQPRYRYGPAMAAVALTSEQLLGWRTDSPLRQKQQAGLMTQLPSAALARGRDRTQLHNEYYWYYGTIAMFQIGGESWERWNARLRDALLPLQDRSRTPDGRKRHTFGSWTPYGPGWGKWGRMGGRVYTTAICTLTLEIYYRHTPAYLDDHLVVTAGDWQAFLASNERRERRRALACLRELRVEVAEPVLVELLAERDRRLALEAAEALAQLDSPLGRPVLQEVLPTLPPWERALFEQARRRAVEMTALPPVAGHVRLFDARLRLATLDLPRAYVGMSVSIRHDEREIARLRVIQRFTGRTVVLAELTGELGDRAPQSGDSAVAQ